MARLALLLALALPLTASARSTSFEFFQTPSHNIGCAYSTSPENLRCDIRTGLKPPPAKPRGCMNDWTFGYQLSGRGPARTVCAGDTVFSPSASVLHYATNWRRGHVGCTSRYAGLYCSNGTQHGFWLSRKHSYRYEGSMKANRIRTPSGKIACQYLYLPPINLQCEVSGGIKPRPPKPKSCEFGWAPGYDLSQHGTATPYCSSGTINLQPQTTLRYGQTWRRPGFTCTSRSSGLTCRNLSAHGMFLSVQHSYRF